MHPIVKPLGILLLITLLLSGLTSISTNSPGLAPDPTDDRHESNYSEWEDAFVISKDGDVVVKRSSGSHKSKKSIDEPTSPVTADPVLPVADFIANVTGGPVPLTVEFTDLSSNSTSWSWDVDNDGTADYFTQTAFHTYNSTGLYSVNLTSSNINGTDSELKINYINVTSVSSPVTADPVLPVADFIANVTGGPVPLTVEFTDLSSNSTSWSWDVDNDGTADYFTQTAFHTYNSTGLYSVNLTSSNINGTDSELKINYINVTSVSSPVTADPVLPVADFIANVTGGPVPLTVEFTDLSSNSTSWSWDVDNDGTADYFTQTAFHTYNSTGLYSVNLTSSNINGTDSELKINYINVTPLEIDLVASIDIEVYTEGEDADSPTGPFVQVGSDVEWVYYVENTGNVNLTIVVVSDNRSSVNSETINLDYNGVFEPGEVWIYNASGTVVEGQYVNLANVTAQYEDSYVYDEDLSHYLGISDIGGLKGMGYWKKPDNWPIDFNFITIGGITYTKEEAISNMRPPVYMPKDKTYSMFGQLVAAKLNYIVNSSSYTCAKDYVGVDFINDSDTWMENYGPVGNNVSGDSDAWQTSGEDLKDLLADYNKGKLCI
ncbi:PKD domain-containing protein [Methanococcoides sp. FTZ1]|uniref:PKD domain-containing protein n=1 Tax=Methanococcoides sp. FTZ1 TaxID=3439061 RepID=UPI003F83772A